MKRQVILAQISHRYGQNVMLPYSVGCLWAYAQTQPNLMDEYELGGFLYDRDPIDDVIARMDSPDIFGASAYIWNWNYTKALGMAVRAAFPDCLIVLGGPQLPKRVFDECHWADVAVHGEGELGFVRVLRERLAGVKHRHVEFGADRVDDLASLPSPYVSGVFSELMALPVSWQPTYESNRGCPFQCTMCNWGSAVYDRVRKFDLARIKAEIEWFAQHRIDLVFSADANFGIMREDVEHAQALIEANKRSGYPKKLRACYAKKHTPRMRELAKALSDAGMSKGVTLAMQSMDEHVLELIKRRNISIPDLAELAKWYRANGVPTYTELILGLPGETYDSWADGIQIMLEAGQHDGINVYACMLLPGSEMAEDSYIAEHGLRTVTVPMLLTHGIPETDPYNETYDIVIETATMPLTDWRRAYVFAWAVQCFHSMGLLRFEALRSPLSYRRFYEDLIELGSKSGELTIIGRELAWLEGVIDTVLSGGPWDVLVDGAGDIMWPPEEASFLRIVQDLDRFYDELSIHPLNGQRYAVVTPEGWPSLENYAREIVWYGRKGGQFLRSQARAA